MTSLGHRDRGPSKPTTKAQQAPKGTVAWLRDRLTRKRLIAVGLLVLIAGGAIALGDPLAHDEAGPQPDGQVGLSEMPRIVYVTAIAIAFILAMPPRDPDQDP